MGDHTENSGSEEDYEVEGIVGHIDSSRHGRKYEVKWKGYKDTTFEPRENFIPNSENLVVKYDKKHPLKKSSISTKWRSKLKKGGKTRKDTSPSDGEATDSNFEEKKPYVEVKRKMKSSERVKTKIKSNKKIRKKSARFVKIKESTMRRSRKNMGIKKNRMVIQQSSSESSQEVQLSSSEWSQEEHEVELLLKHEDFEDTRMYHVKWKGYPKSEATWEPSSHLSCRTLVRKYEKICGKWKRPRKRARIPSDRQRPKRRRSTVRKMKKKPVQSGPMPGSRTDEEKLIYRSVLSN